MLSWRGTRSAQQKGAATTDDVYQPRLWLLYGS